MSFTLLDPPLPSFAQFRHLRNYGGKLTMLRRMEIDLISQLELSGEVLDFGGGETTNYRRHLPSGLTLRSVNISDEFNPTDLVAIGDPIPFEDAQFDAVITFNTLEHIYDDQGSLADITRVLKPGCALHIIVPWMYPVHGHPDDFNRHTPSWWAATLAGLGCEEVSLLPLVFGRRTSALQIKGRGDKLVRGIVESWAAAFDILEARARFGNARIYSGRRGQTVWSSAPGWYIKATKATTATDA